MVRTMDSGSRAAGGKAPRKGTSTPSSSSNSSSKATSSSHGTGGGGGNPVCPRETPSWQKSISTFFTKNGTATSNKPENNEQCKKDEIKENSLDANEHIDKKIKLSTENNEENIENKPSSSNSEDKPRRKRYIIEDDEDD